MLNYPREEHDEIARQELESEIKSLQEEIKHKEATWNFMHPHSYDYYDPRTIWDKLLGGLKPYQGFGEKWFLKLVIMTIFLIIAKLVLHRWFDIFLLLVLVLNLI